MLDFRTADGRRVRLHSFHLLTADPLLHDPRERQATLARMTRWCVPESHVPVLVRWPAAGRAVR